MRYVVMTGLLAAIGLAGCGKSGSTTPGTAPSAGEKLKQDMTVIKDVATQAAADAKPALQNATQKGKEMIHEGAQKVANWTATQPGTLPTPTPPIPR